MDRWRLGDITLLPQRASPSPPAFPGNSPCPSRVTTGHAHPAVARPSPRAPSMLPSRHRSPSASLPAHPPSAWHPRLPSAPHARRRARTACTPAYGTAGTAVMARQAGDGSGKPSHHSSSRASNPGPSLAFSARRSPTRRSAVGLVHTEASSRASTRGTIFSSPPTAPAQTSAPPHRKAQARADRRSSCSTLFLFLTLDIDVRSPSSLLPDTSLILNVFFLLTHRRSPPPSPPAGVGCPSCHTGPFVVHATISTAPFPGCSVPSSSNARILSN